MVAEVFSLLRALLWPVTTLIIVLMYRHEIRRILIEVPSLTRRVVSLKALGAEVNLDSLTQELPKAEEASKGLVIPFLSPPERESPDGTI